MGFDPAVIVWQGQQDTPKMDFEEETQREELLYF